MHWPLKHCRWMPVAARVHKGKAGAWMAPTVKTGVVPGVRPGGGPMEIMAATAFPVQRSASTASSCRRTFLERADQGRWWPGRLGRYGGKPGKGGQSKGRLVYRADGGEKAAPGLEGQLGRWSDHPTTSESSVSSGARRTDLLPSQVEGRLRTSAAPKQSPPATTPRSN